MAFFPLPPLLHRWWLALAFFGGFLTVSFVANVHACLLLPLLFLGVFLGMFLGATVPHFLLSSSHFSPAASPNNRSLAISSTSIFPTPHHPTPPQLNTHADALAAALAELSAFGTKPDRALSPSTMSDDSRRDLIARQRSALYGDSTFPEGSFVDENGVTRQATPAQPGRGHSPLAFEAPAPKDAAAGAVGTPAEERSSPFENRGASGSPAANSPPNAKGQSGSVAPIGTRPAATTANSSNSTATTGTTAPATSTAAPNQATAQKGRTTPLPSPLSYGFGAPAAQEKGEDAKEGAANAQAGNGNGNGNGGMGWGKGAGGGVWGKGALGVQASVWG